MNYNQFWNNENIEETEEVEDQKEQTEDVQGFADWEEEFDSDDNENSQDYSDDIDSADCEPCSFLSEQEEIEDPDIYEESVDPETEEEMFDDSNQYSVSSLFDYDEVEQTAEFDEVPLQSEPQSDVQLQPEESAICFTTDFTEDEQQNEIEPVEEQPEEVQDSNPSLPPLLNQVFSFIPSYCCFGTYLKTLSDGDVRDIEAFINKTKDAWISDKKDKMFNIPLSNITIAVLNDVDDPLVHSKRLQTLGIQMFAAEESKWNCLNLFFERDGNLKRAEIEEISKDSFEDWQWKIVQSTGFELWKSRQK